MYRYAIAMVAFLLPLLGHAANFPKGCTEVIFQEWERTVSSQMAAKASYPVGAYRKGIEGNGILEIVIESNGEISSVVVQKSAGTKYLDKLMVAAVLGANVTPLTCAGVAVRHKLRTAFKLAPPNPNAPAVAK